MMSVNYHCTCQVSIRPIVQYYALGLKQKYQIFVLDSNTFEPIIAMWCSNYCENGGNSVYQYKRFGHYKHTSL